MGRVLYLKRARLSRRVIGVGLDRRRCRQRCPGMIAMGSTGSNRHAPPTSATDLDQEQEQARSCKGAAHPLHGNVLSAARAPVDHRGKVGW